MTPQVATRIEIALAMKTKSDIRSLVASLARMWMQLLEIIAKAVSPHPVTFCNQKTRITIKFQLTVRRALTKALALLSGTIIKTNQILSALI